VQKTSHLYPSMSKTAAHIIKTEGLTGFWRGNLTNCVRVVPHAAVQFVSYDKFKIMMIGSSDGKLSIPQRLLCGSLSGICAASVTQPLDVVRIRLQTDAECNKGSVRLAVKQMMQEPGGVRNFYKGYTPAMLSLAPFIAVNFAAFDSLKAWYYGTDKCTKQELQGRNPLVPLVLGALSGIIAQTICYPLDTVRRRMQLKGVVYPNTVMAFVTIFKQEGMPGFYRGMTPNALKVMPNNAIRFAMYETLKNWFVEDDD
jgi:solute carrier family 25 phosphate transporter 23/24/25/41